MGSAETKTQKPLRSSETTTAAVWTQHRFAQMWKTSPDEKQSNKERLGAALVSAVALAQVCLSAAERERKKNTQRRSDARRASALHKRHNQVVVGNQFKLKQHIDLR